ncbi:MAG: ATP-binding protein [Bacteroidota bacterium]
MKELLINVTKFGSHCVDSNVERVRLSIFNISCLIGAITPIISAYSYLLVADGLHPLAILASVSTSLFFSCLLYLNKQGRYYTSSLLASFAPIIACGSVFVLTGGLVDYEFIVLILSLSPFLYFYKKRWYAFAFAMLHFLIFLIGIHISFPPIAVMNEAIIMDANQIVYITTLLVLLYEATAIYYLHEVALKDWEKRGEELVKAKEEAEKNNALKSSFLANMSHEIRTPMNSIIGFSDYMLNDDVDESERERYARIINTSCQQLLHILNDVLDFSKIETRQVNVNNQATNIVDLIISLYQFFELRAHQKKLSLHLHCEIDEANSWVVVDPVKLRQILSNYLSNAIKYTQQGTIRLLAKIEDRRLIFCVEDTGKGIKAEFHDLVFQRFRQLEDNADTGTGLGLAISKGFAELMGGEVWLTSKAGVGSAFYLALPYVPSQKVVSSVLKESQQDKAIEFHHNRVLVAEDEVFNFRLLEVVFKQLGVAVVWAKNGAEAIQQVKENPLFDLILMDIKMPVLDGLSATRIIKRSHPNLPIIAQSAFAFMDEKEQSLAAGCDYYLAKPIKKQDLLDAFSICLERSALSTL